MVALRYNEMFGEYEHINRRARGFPIFVYINSKDMLVIADDGGKGSDERHYIVGKYVGGAGQTDPDDPLNQLDGPELPNSDGYAVIPVELTPMNND